MTAKNLEAIDRDTLLGFTFCTHVDVMLSQAGFTHNR